MSSGYDEELHMQRVALTMEQWPHTDRVWGCENCTLLFASPDNARCPSCSSEQIFDLATALVKARETSERKAAAVSDQLGHLIEVLDEGTAV